MSLRTYGNATPLQLVGAGAFFNAPDIGNPIAPQALGTALKFQFENPIAVLYPLPPVPPRFSPYSELPPRRAPTPPSLYRWDYNIQQSQTFATVPDVSGPITQADAAAAIIAAGLTPQFTLGWIGLAFTTQSAAPGTQEPFGTILIVSPVGLIGLPDFRGMYVQPALDEIAALDLFANVIQIGYPSEQDIIVDQVPPPGIVVPLGFVVTLYRGLRYYPGTQNRHGEDPDVVIGSTDQ